MSGEEESLEKCAQSIVENSVSFSDSAVCYSVIYKRWYNYVTAQIELLSSSTCMLKINLPQGTGSCTSDNFIQSVCS